MTQVMGNGYYAHIIKFLWRTKSKGVTNRLEKGVEMEVPPNRHTDANPPLCTVFPWPFGSPRRRLVSFSIHLSFPATFVSVEKVQSVQYPIPSVLSGWHTVYIRSFIYGKDPKPGLLTYTIPSLRTKSNINSQSFLWRNVLRDNGWTLVDIGSFKSPRHSTNPSLFETQIEINDSGPVP